MILYFALPSMATTGIGPSVPDAKDGILKDPKEGYRFHNHRCYH